MKNLLKTINHFRLGGLDWQVKIKATQFRKRVSQQVPSDEPLLIFAMPLVSRKRSEDWDMVQSNLNATLASFMAQSNENWRVFICGQDRPDLPDDDRIVFITAKIRDKFYDKGDKRRLLIKHIAAHVPRDGYYMQFDADDILHPDFADYILQDHNGSGYLVDKGHFVALATKQVIPLDDFSSYCGSCAAVYVDFRRHRHFVGFLNQHRSHTQIASQCVAYHRPLDLVPFHAVLYITGHGENMFGRRGQLETRTRKLIEDANSDQKALDILAEFGTDWDALLGSGPIN